MRPVSSSPRFPIDAWDDAFTRAETACCVKISKAVPIAPADLERFTFNQRLILSLNRTNDCRERNDEG